MPRMGPEGIVWSDRCGVTDAEEQLRRDSCGGTAAEGQLRRNSMQRFVIGNKNRIMVVSAALIVVAFTS